MNAPADEQLHVITERDDGPDLHDLLRLIMYLREHHMWSHVSQADDSDLVHVSWTPRPAAGERNDRRSKSAWESRPVLNGGYFVGPDGTVYDANGEALA